VDLASSCEFRPSTSIERTVANFSSQKIGKGELVPSASTVTLPFDHSPDVCLSESAIQSASSDFPESDRFMEIKSALTGTIDFSISDFLSSRPGVLSVHFDFSGRLRSSSAFTGTVDVSTSDSQDSTELFYVSFRGPAHDFLISFVLWSTSRETVMAGNQAIGGSKLEMVVGIVAALLISGLLLFFLARKRSQATTADDLSVDMESSERGSFGGGRSNGEWEENPLAGIWGPSDRIWVSGVFETVDGEIGQME
jgi:hypothetical protein